MTPYEKGELIGKALKLGIEVSKLMKENAPSSTGLSQRTAKNISLSCYEKAMSRVATCGVSIGLCNGPGACSTEADCDKG